MKQFVLAALACMITVNAKSDADGLFKLMDANVTRGNLKNLVTDKPAPITVALRSLHGLEENK